MPIEHTNKNNIRILNLVDVITEMIATYNGDREIKFYAERCLHVHRIYSGTVKNITFGALITALNTAGYLDWTFAKCRVTTFDDDDMIVVTII